MTTGKGVEKGQRGGARTRRSKPDESLRRLQLSNRPFDRLTHYLFRYPAKFHPPVVRRLLYDYTKRGQTILDPFCGSGTLLVEASALGRNAIGLDLDPLAVDVSWAKAHRFNASHLDASAQLLLNRLGRMRRDDSEYETRQFVDLTEAEYRAQARTLRPWIPKIPQLHHWFRNYVIIDLAKIQRTIDSVDVPIPHWRFFSVVFASVIRNASNADPVPVSGLEVTSHMKRRDAKGRVINPFQLFESALLRSVLAATEYSDAVKPGTKVAILQGDATRLAAHLKKPVDAVITSPPYHGAVDYYRRHQLEMYWLGHTETREDRLLLRQHYIGRSAVPASHPFVVEGVLATALAKEWEAHIRVVSPERANAFRHYLVAMSRFFDQLATRLPRNAPVLLVVGHSSWNDSLIPTRDLFAEIAAAHFSLEETLWYPVRNRYMSYSRHNGADINTEYVLVLRRRGKSV